MLYLDSPCSLTPDACNESSIKIMQTFFLRPLLLFLLLFTLLLIFLLLLLYDLASPASSNWRLLQELKCLLVGAVRGATLLAVLDGCLPSHYKMTTRAFVDVFGSGAHFSLEYVLWK